MKDDYGHYKVNITADDIKKEEEDIGEYLSRKIIDALEKPKNNKSIDDKEFWAKRFEEKTGWIVYGKRLEKERWVVEDRNCACWTDDAYDDILGIFQNSYDLEHILEQLQCNQYIARYRHDGSLTPLDRFEYRLQDWIVDLVETNLRKQSAEFYKESFRITEEDNMGLRIKKTDVMTIDEFKENDKAYDEIKLCIDKEMYDEYVKDYGLEPFNAETKLETGEKYINLKSETLEYLPKALSIMPDGWGVCVKSVPYEYITQVECTYYLKTE